MRVTFSPASNADLREVGRFIATENPVRAASFTEELYAACLTLGHMPLRFALVPGHESRRLRRKNHRSYAIFYRALESEVEIVRILHGRRDVERLLFQKAP